MEVIDRFDCQCNQLHYNTVRQIACPAFSVSVSISFSFSFSFSFSCSFSFSIYVLISFSCSSLKKEKVANVLSYAAYSFSPLPLLPYSLTLFFSIFFLILPHLHDPRSPFSFFLLILHLLPKVAVIVTATIRMQCHQVGSEGKVEGEGKMIISKPVKLRYHVFDTRPVPQFRFLFHTVEPYTFSHGIDKSLDCFHCCSPLATVVFVRFSLVVEIVTVITVPGSCCSCCSCSCSCSCSTSSSGAEQTTKPS